MQAPVLTIKQSAIKTLNKEWMRRLAAGETLKTMIKAS
jgi:hypothetical protein